MRILQRLRRRYLRSSRSLTSVRFLNRPIENAELARTEYRKGKTILRSLPTIVYFAHSTRCNFRQPCVTCDRHTRPPEAESETNEAVLQAVTPLLKTAQCAILFAGGEPLFSKWFERVISIIEPPTRASFSTNAFLLTKKRTEFILEKDIMGPLCISLDAATPQTYRIMRPASDFEKVIRNVAYYSERTQALNRDSSYVSLNMSVCRTNLEDVPKLVDLALKVGARHIELRHLNKGLNHTVKTVDGWDWVYSEQEEFVDAARHDSLILEAYERAKSNGIRLWFMGAPFIGPSSNEVEAETLKELTKYDPYNPPDAYRWLSPKRAERGPNGHTCHGPWWKIVVQPEGTVRSCCFHDVLRFGSGNILESDVMAIWNSDELMAQRRQTLNKGFSQACLSSMPCAPRGRI